MRCGRLTKKGTPCRWPAKECPVAEHQRPRDTIDWSKAPRKRLPDAMPGDHPGGMGRGWIQPIRKKGRHSLR